MDDSFDINPLILITGASDNDEHIKEDNISEEEINDEEENDDDDEDEDEDVDDNNDESDDESDKENRNPQNTARRPNRIRFVEIPSRLLLGQDRNNYNGDEQIDDGDGEDDHDNSNDDTELGYDSY